MTRWKRFLGILMYRPAAYRDAALNASLSTESWPIEIVVASINSLVYTLCQHPIFSTTGK